MRVLQVTTSNQRRGAEVFAQDLGAALRRLGHQVTTASLESSNDESPLPAVVLGPGRAHPRTGSALIGGMRAHDVTIAHGGPSLIPVGVAGAAARRPFIYRNIGDPEFWGDVRLGGLRIGAPLRRADGVVALYERARTYLLGRYRLQPSRVSVASNAVDLDAFPRVGDAERRTAKAELGFDADSDAPLVAYLGALSPEKRPELAIEVVAAISNVQLVIAGDGLLRAELVALAERAAPGRVRFLGSWDRPSQLLAAADVVLIPSRTEGIPGALLEAAATGTPVVATDVGGVAEVVEALDAGITVAPAASTSRLVDATLAVLDDPRRYTADLTALSEHHGIDAIAKRYDRALHDALRRHQH